MQSKASLQFAILLMISNAVQCQFEFDDMQVVHDIIVQLAQIANVNCLSILRPSNQTANEKSVIDGLTRQLIREFNSEIYARIRPSVMAYTTEQYEKLTLENNIRKRGSCLGGGVIVMVSDLTNSQLVRLSENPAYFEYSFWLLFANRSEVDTLLSNVRIRISTRFWVALPIEDELFHLIKMKINGTSLEQAGYVLYIKDIGPLAVDVEERSDLAGLNLTVGTIPNGSYARVHRNEKGQLTTGSGFYGAIWNDLQEALQFNSVFVTPDDVTFGTIDASGNWTGLYGMVARKEVDVILGPLTITETRYHILDYLHAIQKTKYKIFYKKDADINDWFKVFRPLAYTVWIALVIWIIAGGTLAYFVTLMVKNSQQVSSDITLINCMYFVLRTLCNQGLDQVPKPWALRIFLLTAYLHATLIITSYSASLISFLTVKTPVEPFQALPDILTTDYKLTLNSNSTDYDFFAKTKDPIHRDIYETSIIKTKNIGAYYNEIKTACENRKTVFFGTFTEVAVMYRYTKLPCVLLPLRSEISPVYKTIATAKHSPYREILNRRLFRMIEHGLVNRYSLLYMPDSYDTSLENEIGIGLIDVGAVFIYLVILEALSVAIFIQELLSWKYQLHKIKQTSLQLETAQPEQFNRLDLKE